MYDPLEREGEVIRTLKRLAEAKLEFVVVGGYGVSAYRHRFSIDADIVIKKEDLDGFKEILEKQGYHKTTSKKLENEYSSEFTRYEKKNPKVCIDLLIGGMSARQTGASFSYEFLCQHSGLKTIEGIQGSVKALVPEREVIVILKLHSGRLTDLRDVSAITYDLDLEFIKTHLPRGDWKIIASNLRKLGALLEKPQFQDSFKGVFMEKNYKIRPDEIKKLVELKKSLETK